MNDEPIKALYKNLIDAWNARSAAHFAHLFTLNGNVVGFDGSELEGRVGIEAELTRIFSAHQTMPFITKVKEVRFLNNDTALLRGISGLVKTDGTLHPNTNAIQSLIAKREGGEWKIELFQNTPAQFHDRPDLAKQLAEELSALL